MGWTRGAGGAVRNYRHTGVTGENGAGADEIRGIRESEKKL